MAIYDNPFAPFLGFLKTVTLVSSIDTSVNFKLVLMKSRVAVAKYALIHTHGYNIFISLFLLTNKLYLLKFEYYSHFFFINVQFCFTLQNFMNLISESPL